jgi:hypothetical protein
LQALGGGLPTRLEGGVDTDCIAARDAVIAIAGRAGSLYLSEDDSETSRLTATGFAVANGVHIC